MNIKSEDTVCVLRERIARLEERLMSSDKALELARNAMNSQWTQTASTISIIISLVVLVLHFIKR